jgi:NAD-dependent deacetylase
MAHEDGLAGQAADLIAESRYLVAFTGAGISVESGIPPFRGESGLWSRYDPGLFEIDYFMRHPDESWKLLRGLFYRTFEKASPNRAHQVLADLEKVGILQLLITQNIDSLHHRAGSRRLVEYHGNSRSTVCLECGGRTPVVAGLLEMIPPHCSCGGLLKPDFVFFGEPIPAGASREAGRAASMADVMLVVGTTGEVYPAASLPRDAGRSGARIIEVNPAPSAYTGSITDLFLQGPASEIMDQVYRCLARRY